MVDIAAEAPPPPITKLIAPSLLVDEVGIGVAEVDDGDNAAAPPPQLALMCCSLGLVLAAMRCRYRASFPDEKLCCGLVFIVAVLVL